MDDSQPAKDGGVPKIEHLSNIFEWCSPWTHVVMFLRWISPQNPRRKLLPPDTKSARALPIVAAKCHSALSETGRRSGVQWSSHPLVNVYRKLRKITLLWLGKFVFFFFMAIFRTASSSWIYRCSFPIGWLMNRAGCLPLEPRVNDDRRYTSQRPLDFYIIGWILLRNVPRYGRHQSHGIWPWHHGYGGMVGGSCFCFVFGWKMVETLQMSMRNVFF